MKPAASTDSHLHRIAFLQRLLPIDPAQLPRDIIADITLAVVGIPERIGYTATSSSFQVLAIG
ncbi:hypothetical protein HDG32_004773 [Paraburkholderia sp. CI2]|nr:hypothetical protein [Paraburkholderia sp. CI2]